MSRLTIPPFLLSKQGDLLVIAGISAIAVRHQQRDLPHLVTDPHSRDPTVSYIHACWLSNEAQEHRLVASRERTTGTRVTVIGYPISHAVQI
jgi:hypothetical protein